MLVEILLALIVVAVGALMVVDVVRTQGESPHGRVDGQAYDAKRPSTAAGRGSRESFPGVQAGTAVPAAAHDAGPARRTAGAGSPAGEDQQPRAHAAAASRGSRRTPGNWHVRSRLALLVLIPLAAATVAGFCVAHIADVLGGTQINSPVGSVRNGAILSAVEAGIVMVIVAALASWFTIVLARSVLQPLYRLRRGALELTGGRLADAVRRASENQGSRAGAPSGLEPIDVESADEIGEISRAFDETRRELLRLAVGEAALHPKLNTMLVNLSHRGQSLMERQIRLLRNLEQGEQNAERLATLFRVDRIGKRMHRYSENLLILVGHEPSGGWNQPVALVNVIRAAVSEIEEYQRVSLNAQPDVTIAGSAVNDVIRLLTELTENATSFSAADMQVDIAGRVLTSGGVLLDITDRGVGMTPKELAYANWRLENPPTADTNVPKWIGLFVVARLAARHGIRVRLQAADYGGLTALVWLPDEVLVQQGTMATGLGGFAGAGSRRGLHEVAPDPGYATAEQAVTTARFAPPSGDARPAPLDRRLMSGANPRPAERWSPTDPQPALRTGSPTATGSAGSGRDSAAPGGNETPRPAGARQGTAASVSQETSSADGVIVPSAEALTEERRLPIFNAVESSWFTQGRSAPGPSAATGNRWSSPADVGWRAASVADSPSSDGSTAAGLPRRAPNANLIPGAIPSAEPVVPTRSAAAVRKRLAGLQRGVDQGRAAARQAASADDDEATQAGPPD